MSLMNRRRERIPWPGDGAEAFWRLVRQRYAGCNRRTWRHLAMLVLLEDRGWPLDLVASTFGRKVDDVARCLDEVKRDLRMLFAPEPDRDEEP